MSIWKCNIRCFCLFHLCDGRPLRSSLVLLLAEKNIAHQKDNEERRTKSNLVCINVAPNANVTLSVASVVDNRVVIKESTKEPIE